MLSLLSYSFRLANRIFLASLVEWTILGIILFSALYAAQDHLTYLGIAAGVILPGVILFMFLSQIRGALLVLGETEVLDTARIYKNLMVTLRFAMLILASLVVLSMAAAMLITFLGHVSATHFPKDSGVPMAPDRVFIHLLLQVGIILVGVGLICAYIYSLAMLMVPLAAAATSMGHGMRIYDPFYGLGAHRNKGFAISLIVLFLAGCCMVVAGYVASQAIAVNSVGTGQLTDMQAFVQFGVPVLILFFVLVWLSSVWFSASALLFLVTKDEHKDIEFEAEMAMYGRILSGGELRALRKQRTPD